MGGQFGSEVQMDVVRVRKLGCTFIGYLSIVGSFILS